MSFDDRLRTELRTVTALPDLDEDAALRRVKATGAAPIRTEAVALGEIDEPLRRLGRAQRVVGLVAAAALLAGAIALPLTLRDRSHQTAPLAADQGSGPRYRSTVVVRIAAPPQRHPSPTTTVPAYTLGDPRRLALAPSTLAAARVRSHLRAGDNRIGFNVASNRTGDLVSLTVTAPTSALAGEVPRNWATTFVDARRLDARHQLLAARHALNLSVQHLRTELLRIDTQLAKLMPAVYGNVAQYDAPNGHTGQVTAPPDVPEQGSVKALNLAFERIQIHASLTEYAARAASERFGALTPAVFGQVVSQSRPVLIHRPHRSTTSTVVIAFGLLLGGLILAASALWIGRRRRRLSLGSAGSR